MKKVKEKPKREESIYVAVLVVCVCNIEEEEEEPREFIPQGALLIGVFELMVKTRSDLEKSESLLSRPSSIGGICRKA